MRIIIRENEIEKILIDHFNLKKYQQSGMEIEIGDNKGNWIVNKDGLKLTLFYEKK